MAVVYTLLIFALGFYVAKITAPAWDEWWKNKFDNHGK